MLLYIHVPFCRAKCRYCAFYSEPLDHEPGLGGAMRLRGYTDALLMELALWGDRLGRREVSTIFFGGGTPSLLPMKTMGIIMDRIRRTFSIRSDAEISLEANPESLTDRAAVRELRRLGFNRLSLGFQSLNDAHLELLGRPHRGMEASGAFNLARDAGFNNINVDLIWGLPGQKVSQWLQLIKAVRDMQPEHVSAYGLTLEPGTPLAQDVECGRLQLPDERDMAVMYAEGSALLEEKGLMQYEISNYARIGFQCRHNCGYWEGQDYLGLGPSATSTIEGHRWTNPSSFGEWGRDVTRRRLGLQAEHLTPREQLEELIMLRLRTVKGLRLKDFQAMAGEDLVNANPKLFQALHQSKFIRILSGHLRLTRKGMLVSNSILSALFETLEHKNLEVVPDAALPEPQKMAPALAAALLHPESLPDNR